MLTIEEAKKYCKENADTGCNCPVCGQHVQIYRYPLFATSAFALALLYRLFRTHPDQDFFHVRQFAEQTTAKIRSPHFAELRFWGLIEPLTKKTKDENSMGMWRITAKGIRFVQGEEKVPKYIRIYNNKFLGFAGDTISIYDAFGNKFDYPTVMGDYYQTKVDSQGRLF